MKHAFCLSMLFIILLAHSSISAKEQALDVALVLDTSGSMKSNDPQRLRSQAAKLFIKLLDRKDRVSLVSFSNRAYPVTDFLSLDKRKNEQLLFNAIDKLSSSGQYTNLHDALLRGYELLSSKSSQSRGKTIILMSDGKMDLGSESRNLRLLEKTLDNLTPKLAAENIKVHTIAFTTQSYIPLLKLAAKDTGGEFVLLNDNRGIHQVFENLFERSKLPEMLPINEDSFVVDKSIREITIVASKFKSSSFISLESPDGEEINLENYQSNVSWFTAKKYDLITIKNPAAGYWLVKYTEGGNKVYLLADLNLVVNTTKKTSEPGSPLHIEAYLTKGNKRIKNHTILDNTRFTVTVTSPEAVEIENVLLDDGSEIGSERKDGIYGISYAFDLEGPYKISVSAISQTFDRTRSLFVNVKSSSPRKPFDRMRDPVLEKKPQKIAEPEVSEVENPEASADVEQEKLTASMHDKETTETNTHAGDAAPIIDGSHTEEHIEQVDLHGPSIYTEEEKTEEDGTSYRFAIFVFIIFNILLAALGGAYYFYNKRKKQNNSDDNDDEKKLEDTRDEEPKPNEKPEETKTSQTSQTTATNFEDSGNSLSSLSELDLDDELSSILESMDDIK